MTMSPLLVAFTFFLALVTGISGYFFQKRGAFRLSFCIELFLRFIWILALLPVIAALLMPEVKTSAGANQAAITLGVAYLAFWLTRRLTVLCSKK